MFGVKSEKYKGYNITCLHQDDELSLLKVDNKNVNIELTFKMNMDVAFGVIEYIIDNIESGNIKLEGETLIYSDPDKGDKMCFKYEFGKRYVLYFPDDNGWFPWEEGCDKLFKAKYR